MDKNGMTIWKFTYDHPISPEARQKLKDAMAMHFELHPMGLISSVVYRDPIDLEPIKLSVETTEKTLWK